MKLKTEQHLRHSSLAEFESTYVLPNPGRALIVGSKVYGEKEDRRHRYQEAVGIDMLEGEGVDLVWDLEREDLPDVGLFDHVECMSVLEHSRQPWKMAATLERLMNPGATIFLSVPFVWRIHAYPNDYFRMSPEGVRSLFPGIEWERLLIAGDKLREDKVTAIERKGHPFFARAETAGFGRRCES